MNPPDTMTYYAESRHLTSSCVSTQRLVVEAFASSLSAAGQPAHPICGCVTGTVDCSGTCTQNTTTVTNDGTCTGTCGYAYTQLRDPCGSVTNAQFGSYEQSSCRAAACYPAYSASCRNNNHIFACGGTDHTVCLTAYDASDYMVYGEAFSTTYKKGCTTIFCYFCTTK
jgi:hypothetical protein